MLVSYKQEGLDEWVIRQCAHDYEIVFQEFLKLDILLIGREYQYDEEISEWSGQYVTDESSCNLLTDSEIDIPKDMCLLFDDLAGAPTLNTIYGNKATFYNPTTEEEFSLSIYKKIAGNNLLNRSGSVTDIVVLDDSDFAQLKKTLDTRYQLKYYLFNTEGSMNALDFHDALLNTVVKASDGMILDNFFESPVRTLMILKGKDASMEDSYMTYEGNELYAARWWDMYPFSRETSLSTQIETGAIYFLLMSFIEVITFVSAVMVIGLKILGTIWQDKENYQKATFLGLKEEALKKFISKQIPLIYFYPTVFGCIIGVIMINQIVLASSSTHTLIITFIAAILALIVLFIQIILYLFLKKSIFIRLLVLKGEKEKTHWLVRFIDVGLCFT